MKIFNYMLEIDILRNSSQNFLGVLRGAFEVFGCPKRHPDALLAKTMCTPQKSNPGLSLEVRLLLLGFQLLYNCISMAVILGTQENKQKRSSDLKVS